MKVYPVLFVDDEVDLIDTFLNNFQDSFTVLTATSGPDALAILRVREVAVMVTDQRMPGMHGLEVIRRGLELRPDLVPIILTGFTNDRDLIEAINLRRIHRYLAKPWDPDELRHSIEGGIERYRLVQENRRLTAELQETNERLRAENAYLKAADVPRMLIGETPPVHRLLDEIRRVAPKDVTVLIEGETGTGKELVARSIHAASGRRERLFVAVNCAELSQDAAESRLFGHRKGSFTGAIDDHKGFFEVAHEGTLFLDEIGELSTGLQAKLLRVLQEGEIVRFGDSKPRRVDVRVIAATNRVLDDEVKAGRFRADLLYRLKVVPIRAPSLRDRRDDIPTLAEHFLTVHARKMGVPVPELAPEARRALLAHEFPGNVRDLENMMIRALVMAEPVGAITLADLAGIGPDLCDVSHAKLDAAGEGSSAAGGLLDTVARFEREQIEGALEAAGGNRAQAARALKISYRWLLKKLERYGMASASQEAFDRPPG
jgi:two-component system response regulator HupR/HoxA